MRRILVLAVLLVIVIVAGGAQAEPSTLTIRVQALRVSDDDGSRPANTTPEQMQAWVRFANAAFACAGIQFDFDPERDFADLRSTILNNVTGKQDANWLIAKQTGNQIAARYPGRLVIFSRFGPGENPTGGGFSWWDYNFVVMPGFGAASHCGHPHTDACAHEIGHYLGLPHTFAGDPFPNVAAAESRFRIHGDNPGIFDGDGFSDTLPDPSIRSLECRADPEVMLDGLPLPLPRDNLMSYYDERRTLTPLQVRRARWVLAKRLAGQGALPDNRGARAPLEAELLRVLKVSNGYTSVQPMDGFGEGNWSAGAQLFWGATRNAAVTLELPVSRKGRYQITLYATTAPDFGTVQVFLDGKALGEPFDGYSPIVLPSGPIALDVVDLAAGPHELEFGMVGANAASSDTKFGLDCIDLVPIAAQ